MKFSFYDVGEYRIFYEWREWERKIPDGVDSKGDPKMRVIGDYISLLILKNGQCVKGEWL